MDREEIAEVLSLYPAGSIKKITPAIGGLTNDNFFVDTDQGQFFLRRRNPAITPDSIDFELSLIDHLFADGFPTAPIIRTAEGAFRVELNGRYWELYRRLPGEHFKVENLEQVRSAARLLARFHRAAADYPFKPSNIADRNIDLSKAQKVIDQFEDEARRRIWLIGPVVAPKLADFFRSQADVVVDCIKPITDLPKTLIHGDFQPSNILFKGNEAAALLDFGEASLFYRAYDVAKALLRFSTLKPDYHSQMDMEPSMDLVRAMAFLEAYQSELPLSETELLAMPALLRGTYLYDVGFFMGTEKNPARKIIHLIRAWRFIHWLKTSREVIREMLFPGRGVLPTCSY
ncbi:MAG TPA: homoserine kinase [Methanotrichaceae archaeon]|nr:homoserine kinase [Methanotrichaceae archaeon]